MSDLETVVRVDGWSEGDNGSRLVTYQILDAETGKSLHVGTFETKRGVTDETMRRRALVDAKTVKLKP